MSSVSSTKEEFENLCRQYQIPYYTITEESVEAVRDLLYNGNLPVLNRHLSNDLLYYAGHMALELRLVDFAKKCFSWLAERRDSVGMYCLGKHLMQQGN